MRQAHYVAASPETTPHVRKPHPPCQVHTGKATPPTPISASEKRIDPHGLADRDPKLSVKGHTTEPEAPLTDLPIEGRSQAFGHDRGDCPR